MSAGAATNKQSAESGPMIAATAVVLGVTIMGERTLLAQGAVIRSYGHGVKIGTGSAILENSVVVGDQSTPTRIGRRSVFGHRCTVVGATVGDLCEIGNASILMPGSHLGDRVFLAEGTLVPAGASLPSDSVAVGRPARIIRSASEEDMRRLAGLRDGDLSIPARTAITVETSQEINSMGQLYEYRGILPRVAESAVLFPTAEITGDVVVGERTIIGAGVKIIGDSHGPVRIGNDVQILENTVLHLLPDNDLIIHDGVIIGPGAMIHGCRIGARSVIEPGAIVCDHAVIGPRSVVRAGAVVKQRSAFPAEADLDGFPAMEVGQIVGSPQIPSWAFQLADLPVSASRDHAGDQAGHRARTQLGYSEKRSNMSTTRYLVGGDADGRPTNQACSHLDTISDVTPSTLMGCEDCLREGSQWVHLRECLQCGHVGCCDNSPRRHASAHWHASTHPLMRSFEPGENWAWCYPDSLFLVPSISS
jgi:carbonic anhydrase/acetyltransferase-like protein (isoleucine patch superfamily)